MPSPIKLGADYSALQLRALVKSAKTNSQSGRLLSLAAVLDGMNRTDPARIGGMDRQTLRDWVHRFNQLGPDGLCDVHAGGVEPRLSADQKSELAALVDAGPDLSVDESLQVSMLAGLSRPAFRLVLTPARPKAPCDHHPVMVASLIRHQDGDFCVCQDMRCRAAENHLA